MDRKHEPYLTRCVELAATALAEGSEPFGSILVDGDGGLLAEDLNRQAGGDPTQHPELALARWAAARLTPTERAAATVYTSCEHCAMCAAAHAWCGLGEIVFATSAAQLTTWATEAGVPPAPVLPLSIREVAPGIAVRGPFPEFGERLHALHLRAWARR